MGRVPYDLKVIENVCDRLGRVYAIRKQDDTAFRVGNFGTWPCAVFSDRSILRLLPTVRQHNGFIRVQIENVK